jgi:2-keto-4-pentenoate hydratase/2-oxohepta-3-ene-1,7-dioic acid hydratase in catechol pathway
MVYSGKIYETQGAEAVGVHDADMVRPLAPVGRPNSIRLFRNEMVAGEDIGFVYANPASLVGASQLVPYPAFTRELGFEPFLAAVVVADGYELDLAQADDIILGLTIMNLLVARDVDQRSDGRSGRSRDIAATIGPVVTTPDELDEAIVDSEHGRRYEGLVVARVNSVEVYRGSLEELETSLAQAVSYASQSCPLIGGDVIAIGPIADTSDLVVQPNDEIQVSVERLGMLATKISDEHRP